MHQPRTPSPESDPIALSERISWKVRLVSAIRHRVQWTVNVATVMVVVATLLSFLAKHWWVADIVANLRIQLLIGVVGILVFAAGQRRWKLLAVPLLLCVIHAPFPASALWRSPQPAGPPLLRLTTANVLTANRRFADITTELLRSESDVIAILELSPDLQQHLKTDHEFSTRFPHSRTLPSAGGNFGIGLYAQHAFEDAKLDYFNDAGIHSVIATLRRDHQLVRIIATHTFPPVGQGAFEHRNKHLQLLADRVHECRQQSPDQPVIVMGDLNITPWSPIFRDFERAAGVTSAAYGHSVRPTWFRFNSFAFGLVLDHLLATPDLSCTNYTIGPHVGSDHRFVTAEFSLQPRP